MSRDPAVLLYTSDFLTGTMFFTDEEVGQYIRLLCAQHQKGHLSKADVFQICKSYDNRVLEKFTIDGDGKYYQHRMDEEILKRQNYCNSRSHKGISGKKPLNHTEIIRKSYGNHSEDDNDNEIDTKDVDEIYKLYPSKSSKRSKVAKSLRDKEKIAKVLKTGYPLKMAVESILNDDYPKDLATFLNHLPDPETIKPIPVPKPRPKYDDMDADEIAGIGMRRYNKDLDIYERCINGEWKAE